MNRKIEDLLGYTMEEWLDQPDMWIEVLHPDDRERELAAHDLASTTGDPWAREYRMIGAEGQVVWLRDQAVLLRDIDGNATRWQGVMVDITAEKEAQLALAAAHDELEFRVRARTAALQETNELMGIEIAERQRAEEERLRAEQQLGHILDNVPAVVYLWQMREADDGTFSLFITPKIAEMLGYSPTEWADGGWRTRLHPHDRERVNEAARRSIEHGDPFQMEYRYLARDGRVVWVVDHAVLQQRNARGEPLLFEGVMMNVTALHEAEEKAAEAESRFRTLVERGPAIQYSYILRSWDPPHVSLEYVSPQLSHLLGVSADAWIDDPLAWFAMIHPDDRDDMLAASRHTWQTGEPWASEYRILAADGNVVWLADRGHCVERDDQGRPTRFLGAITDVTDRREQLAELEAELATLRAVTDSGARRVLVRDRRSTGRHEPIHLHVARGGGARRPHAGAAARRTRALPAAGAPRRPRPGRRCEPSVRSDRRVGGHVPGPAARRGDPMGARQGPPRRERRARHQRLARRHDRRDRPGRGGPGRRPRALGLGDPAPGLAGRRQDPDPLGQVLPEVLGDLNAAVGALVVLQDRDQRARDRRGRAVQRVQDLDGAVRARRTRACRRRA